ncbi:MAG: PEGA domain-containing protein [Elusimicrobiota bacterium]
MIPGLFIITGRADKKSRPDWIAKPPLPDSEYVYFIGIKTDARSIEAGRTAAARDVMNQIVEYIGIRVTSKMIFQKSELITRLNDEIRTYGRANIRGAVIKEMYYEQNIKEGTYDVYILTRYQKKEIEREKEKLLKVSQHYNREINNISAEILTELKRGNITKVYIGEFKELLSRRRYAFSSILENGFKTNLTGKGVDVTEDESAEYLLTGTYYTRGNDIKISINIFNKNTKISVFAKTISVLKDSLEPGWLDAGQQEDRFFSELKREPATPGRFGDLRITSDPVGAKIFIDGEPWGKTDIDIHHAPVGLHNITLIKDKYGVYTETVDIKEGKVYKIKVTLEAQKGKMRIRTNPSGAECFVNEEYYGKTPKKISGLPIGKYKVTVKKKNYREHSQEVEIMDDTTVEKIFELDEKDGALFITSTPSGAKVYIGSLFKGLASPLYIEKISSGKHVLRIEMKGYEPWEKTVRVRAFKTETISAQLKKLKTGTVKIFSAPSAATIYIAGTERGYTPADYELEPGVYEVEIDKTGYESWYGTVKVKAGEEIKIFKQLPK